MTKKLVVDPEAVRRSAVLEIADVPINAYALTVEEELRSNDAVTPERCVRVYRDMVLIREFETMLDTIKKLGEYHDVQYAHKGPAHLSIGQEAAAVGECFHLTVDDHIFGSHRSHGEIIAKGLRAVDELQDSSLDKVMREYFDGDVLRVAESGGAACSPLAITFETGGGLQIAEHEELGIDFLLYGLLAEIFGRETGFNRGMGGSMHAFFIPFGVYPNNAIVGGSADIATGAALFKKVRRQKGIAVANIGDASLGCGPVWEALGFASMGQYWKLWDEDLRGGLPIVFNFVNNFYGMGGQPIGETMGIDHVARVGAGVNAINMNAECVDGNHPLSVADAYARKRQAIEQGDGPVLLEVVCYRQSGHSPSDQSSYRSREEMEQWRAIDPIVQFGEKIIESGIVTQPDLDTIQAYAVEKVRKACRLAASLEHSPRLRLGPRTGLANLTFSNCPEEELPGLDRADDVLMPLEENLRVKQIAAKSRSGVDAAGNLVKESKAVSIRDTLFEVIVHHFYNDSRVIAYGEENRDWGGAFAVYRGLTECLPHHRLFNSPISEGAIVGTAVGFALEGGRPLVELMYCDFMGRAGDEIFNQLAKWQAMSGGYCKMPVVLRVSVGDKYGAQHSQDWTALAAHIPGLKVVFPATPYAAKGLMASALRGSDPVVFFESQRIYDQTEIFEPGGVPADYYTLPIGEAAVVKTGSDLTIMTFGATLYRAREAADRFEREFGISVELVDGRTLVPFDMAPLLDSVRKTGKLILASDACDRGSYLHTIASHISQAGFDFLDAPVCVIGAEDWIVPPAELEEAYFPQVSWFLDAYHHQIAPLPGYAPTVDRSVPERMETWRRDVR